MSWREREEEELARERWVEGVVGDRSEEGIRSSGDGGPEGARREDDAMGLGGGNAVAVGREGGWAPKK